MARLSGLFHKTPTTTTLTSPVDGVLVPLSSVSDPAFGGGLLGPGAAFTFDGDTVCAPCDGTLSMVAATTHAFGISTATGVEILVHIGLDTVEREGHGFTALVSAGTRVRAGQPIIRLDRDAFADVDLTTPVVVTTVPDGQSVTVEPAGAVRLDSAVLHVGPSQP